MDFSPLILLLFTVLGTSAAHYFPYWMFLAGGKLPEPKNLIARYTAGTLCWLFPFSFWLLSQGVSIRLVLGAWLFAATAGLTVISLYRYDKFIAEKDRRELKDLLERRRDAKSKGTK